ncbi:MAG: hypothetical protein E6G15_10025 [Actinobacteria bacterium]|nr:MAG: hypothetical protein E6G15_10025 [Actinomycetota bacterium]
MTVTAPPRPNDPIEFQELARKADADALIEEARQRGRRRRRIYGAVVAVVALVGVAITVFGRTTPAHPVPVRAQPSGTTCASS